MSPDEEIQSVIASPTSSNWLRKALDESLLRDCVDAANDAELMSELLSRRCAVICGEA